MSFRLGAGLLIGGGALAPFCYAPGQNRQLDIESEAQRRLKIESRTCQRRGQYQSNNVLDSPLLKKTFDVTQQSIKLYRDQLDVYAQVSVFLSFLPFFSFLQNEIMKYLSSYTKYEFYFYYVHKL